MMRKRPEKDNLEEKFISNAIADKMDQSYIADDENVFSLNVKWPFEDIKISPILEEGSSLRKPINLPIKEYEWNSIDQHTKFIGAQKSEWIRYAIFKLMQEEQNYIKNKK